MDNRDIMGNASVSPVAMRPQTFLYNTPDRVAMRKLSVYSIVSADAQRPRS
jgi:hypothetical protein